MTRIGFILVAAAVTSAIASAAGGAAPQWEKVPNGGIDHRAFALGGARIWLLDGNPGGGPTVMRSARVTGTRITSWVATRTPALDERNWLAQLGDDLVFSDSDGMRSFRLQPNGRLGPPKAVGGAPPPKSSIAGNVAQLRDRAVTLADGKPQTEANELGVCCDVDGAVVDQSKAATPGGNPRAYLGVDRRGRLWLAWSNLTGRDRNTSWVMELAPTTLLPKGAPAKAPGLRFAQIVDVVCADTCRLVMVGGTGSRSSKARTFSWAQGESASTPILTPMEFGNTTAAREDGGHLVVAYTANDPKKGLVLAVARGDARGRKMRATSAIPVPQFVGSPATGLGLTVGPMTTFGASSLGAFTVYEASRTHAVTVTVLPIR